MAERRLGDIVISKTDYPPNNDMPKKPKPEVKPVTKGKVSAKKASPIRRFTEMFLGKKPKDVMIDFVNNVAIPGAIGFVGQMAHSLIDSVTYGDSRRPTTHGSDTYISYGGVERLARQAVNGVRAGGRHPRIGGNRSFSDVEIVSKEDAIEILGTLHDLISDHCAASIANYYALAGMPAEYTDHNFGWTNLSGVDITRTRGGWVINLPMATPLA
jgi:hypothetical protein